MTGRHFSVYCLPPLSSPGITPISTPKNRPTMAPDQGPDRGPQVPPAQRPSQPRPAPIRVKTTVKRKNLRMREVMGAPFFLRVYPERLCCGSSYSERQPLFLQYASMTTWAWLRRESFILLSGIVIKKREYLLSRRD